ncbi:MAG: hypothetical protein HND47_10725 [Chloroflexi bacterium]|nr:hypothetical protein [Chloroflexota bacterium]
MNYQDIATILNLFGQKVPPGSHITLLGGGALILLGNDRETLDIDFIGDDINPSELHRQIIQIAKENKILFDIVPLEHFIPLPAGSNERAIPIEQFGNLSVSVADPYSIALSKVDRGFVNDYDDILFLITNGHVNLNQLEKMVQEAVSKAGKYDLNPDILLHLKELKSMFE